MKFMTDQDLIKGCLRKDRKVQRMLFDRFYRSVYNVAKRYVRHKTDSEDVAIIVFNKIFSSLNQLVLRSDDSLDKWIYRIAINTSLQHLRRKEILVFTDQIEEFQSTNTEIWTPPIGTPIEKVKAEIDRLPEGYRTIFLLRVLEGLTHAEIAEHLKISVNTSKSQMLKARRLLMTKISEYESR